MSKIDNDQVKQLETVLTFYANASPQELLSDAGSRALGVLAVKDPVAQVYAKVKEIKKASPQDSDIQFMASLVEIQRRSIAILHAGMEAIRPSLSMLEQERFNAAYEDIDDLCAGLLSKPVKIAKPKKKA